MTSFKATISEPIKTHLCFNTKSKRKHAWEFPAYFFLVYNQKMTTYCCERNHLWCKSSPSICFCSLHGLRSKTNRQTNVRHERTYFAQFNSRRSFCFLLPLKSAIKYSKPSTYCASSDKKLKRTEHTKNLLITKIKPFNETICNKAFKLANMCNK